MRFLQPLNVSHRLSAVDLDHEGPYSPRLGGIRHCLRLPRSLGRMEDGEHGSAAGIAISLARACSKSLVFFFFENFQLFFLFVAVVVSCSEHLLIFEGKKVLLTVFLFLFHFFVWISAILHCFHLTLQEHGKVYPTDLEETRRHMIWQANKKYVDEHNAHSDDFGFTLGLNAFADLESSEFVNLINGFRGKRATNSSAKVYHSNGVRLPSTVDWRTKGAVTGIKNQGQCGSCWAFSTTGSLEGQHFLKTGKLISLSEQQLVDCSGSYGNEGCNGGLMDNSFRYIQANGGDDTESSYPYEAHDDTCRFNPSNVGATDDGYVDIASRDESALQEAVANVGPISVAIDASHMSFQLYSGGVYNEPSCSQTQLDHGVLAIGYGTDGGKDYWLVKNSWGTSWGLQGYIMMSRNKNNQCGIATQASYPKV